MAGVSQGTVSNVLNGKDNVSVEKIRLVEDAAARLGYSINAQAKQLRKNSVFSHYIAVILPNIVENQYAILFTSIKDNLESKGYIVLLFVTDDIPYHEEQIICTIAAIRAAGCIAVTCCHDVENAYMQLEKLGSRLVFIERDVPAPYHFFGFDHRDAGKRIAGYIKQKQLRKVGVLAGLDFFSNEVAFQQGLRAGLANDPSYTVQIITSNINEAMKSAYSLIEDRTPDVIITTSMYLAGSARFVCEANLVDDQPLIISLSSNTFLSEQCGVVKYVLDYGQLGKKVAMFMHQLIDNDQQERKYEIVPAKGIAPQDQTAFVSQRTRINVLMVQNPSTEAIMKMTPEFTKRSNIEVNYTVLPIAEMFNEIQKTLYHRHFDVVRLNTPTLPLTPKERLLPFDAAVFQSITKGMFTRIVNEYSYVQNTPVAIPFDVGVQALAYRKDLFEDPMVKRAYFEANGTRLRVPENYDEFNQVAKFFTREHNPNSQIEYGTSFASGTYADIFLQFLLRYLSFGGKVFDEAQNNVFDLEIGLRTLHNYQELMNYAICVNNNYNFGDGINCFIAGRTAMEIIQTNYAANIIDLKRSTISGRIGYGFLPAKSEWFGGGSLAIPLNSKNQEAALQFIEWATGSAGAETYAFLGGCSAHRHVYENSEVLRLYPVFSLVETIADRSIASELWTKLDNNRIVNVFGAIMQGIQNHTLRDLESMELLKKELDNCRIPG